LSIGDSILNVKCVDNQLSFSVNGNLLQEIEDDTFATGVVGVVGTTSVDSESRLEFDDFKLYLPWKATNDFRVCLVADIGGRSDEIYKELSWTGIQFAAKEFGIQTAFRDSLGEGDYLKNIEASIEDHCDLVVAMGLLITGATESVAASHPSTNFTVIDYVFDPPIDNVLAQVFFMDEAAFLAGYLAAGMTQTGKVATFGGTDILSVTACMDGFALGVEHYNKAHNSSVEVIGWDPNTHQGEFISDFKYEVDEVDAFMLANHFLDEGADIIFPVAGSAGLGAAKAAEDRDAFVIGVDVDWKKSYPAYSDVILTSVVKNIDNLVVEVIRMALEDDLGEGIVYGTLGNGGVDITPSIEGDPLIPQWLREEIASIREEIIEAEIITYIE
jgi:basic membrane protein A